MPTAKPADRLTLDLSGVDDASGWCVAFSGGLDSTVLLHRLIAVAHRPVRAVHIHHGLQAQASDWAQHCVRVANDWGVVCDVQTVTVAAHADQGREAAARAARYDAFAGSLRAGEVLLLAHHRDDQAETVLLRLARGAGADGLAGMPRVRALHAHRLCRPLLSTPRADLLAYARAHGLTWIEDPSNADADLDRNYLRHHVLPALRARWPGFDAAATRTAALLSASETALARAEDQQLRGLRDGDALRADRLRALAASDRMLALRLLRRALRDRGVRTPTQAVAEQMLGGLLTARDDAQPVVRWGGFELRRYRDRLWCMPALPAEPVAWSQPWDGRTPLHLPGPSGVLDADAVPDAVADADRWQVRFARPGDAIAQAGRPRKGFGRWAQEAGIPPWVRTRMPLVVRDDVICAIGATVVRADLAPAALRWDHGLVGVTGRG